MFQRELPYIFSTLNKVLFGEFTLSPTHKIENYLRYRRDYRVLSIQHKIHIEYCNADFVVVRDFVYPVITYQYNGSTIVIQNNKIFFVNDTIDNKFNFDSCFVEEISGLDFNDIFAISTIFDGVTNKELIQILIEEYKELKKHNSNTRLEIFGD